jgi:hypothetical protein
MTFAGITIPFWLYDPQGFSPINIQYSKVSQFESILPFTGISIPFTGGLLAILLAYRYSDGSYVNLLRNSAIVQMFLVFCTVILLLTQVGFEGLVWTGYGVFFLPFGVFAFWASLYGRVANE